MCWATPRRKPWAVRRVLAKRLTRQMVSALRIAFAIRFYLRYSCGNEAMGGHHGVFRIRRSARSVVA